MIKYVGIDGGNSKTHVAVADGFGQVLASVSGPGSSPDKLGYEPAAQIIGELVHECIARAAPESADDELVMAAMLAGLDTPEDIPPLKAALQSRFPRALVHADNDAMAVLLAGTSGSPGVAVVCGAGINAIGWDGRSTRTNFLSLGHLSGDWGGGLSLGRDILWHVARAEDGRGIPTSLTGPALRCFGVDNVRDIVLGLHRGVFSQDKVLDLVPELFRAADSGDLVARNMVARLATEVSTMAIVMATRSGLADGPVHVVLGGSVLTSGHEVLLRPIRLNLSKELPGSQVVLLKQPPVIGSLLAAVNTDKGMSEAKQIAHRLLRTMPTTLVSVEPSLTSGGKAEVNRLG